VVYYGSNKATAHNAEEDNENLITITEKPINHFARQVEMIRSNAEGENYFKKVKIKIMFYELNIEKAKQMLIKHKNTTYYDPDYQTLIQNLINECNVCNQAKTEHRKTSLLLKTTPETEFCREIYVADI